MKKENFNIYINTHFKQKKVETYRRKEKVHDLRYCIIIKKSVVDIQREREGT